MQIRQRVVIVKKQSDRAGGAQKHLTPVSGYFVEEGFCKFYNTPQEILHTHMPCALRLYT